MAALRYRIAFNKGKMPDEKLKNILAGIEEDALTLYLQAKDFLVNINRNNPPGGVTYDVTNLLKNLSLRFNDKSALQISYTCDEEGARKYFTDTIHYQLYLVIKEVVANIIRHGNANKVNIRIFFQDNRCCFFISDNGKGFDREKAKPGFELRSIDDRLKTLNGVLTIVSNAKGTILQACFPV